MFESQLHCKINKDIRVIKWGPKNSKLICKQKKTLKVFASKLFSSF